MRVQTPSHLLSIGEFAAATQLSAKALRLYDEQGLLLPARVDVSSGYRYYRSDQVATGRLIRTLRDMHLSLAEIATVVDARDGSAERLLVQFAQQADRRHAGEKRAFQIALASMRHSTATDGPDITQRHRPAMTTVVRPFMADHGSFVERYNATVARAIEQLDSLRIQVAGEPRCSLIDPLSDDEDRLEILVPVVAPPELPNGVTLRYWPAAPCATIVADARTSHASELRTALDAMFDWFDQRGHRACEPPSVALSAHEGALRTEILWAYEPGGFAAREEVNPCQA